MFQNKQAKRSKLLGLKVPKIKEIVFPMLASILLLICFLALPGFEERKETKVTVVIDVFRAFTTASYVLEQSPASYKLAVKQDVVSQLVLKHLNPLVIGKPEKGMDGQMYHIPNSPTRVLDVEISNRDVIHRTEAGAKGVLSAQKADIVLAAGFVNAAATVNHIKTLNNPKVTILPMGHEGNFSSLEDELCAKYIGALLENATVELTPYLSELKEGPGRYFFLDDQWQYPSADFERCLEIDRFNFAIQAIVKSDYAILRRCN